MRTIEKMRLTAELEKGGAAELVLSLVEKGKVLPFQVHVTHQGPTTAKTKGVLAAVNTEKDAREQYDFHLEEAGKKGWFQALPGRMKIWPGIPDPTGAFAEGAQVPAPPRPKRKPGRPRKVR